VEAEAETEAETEVETEKEKEAEAEAEMARKTTSISISSEVRQGALELPVGSGRWTVGMTLSERRNMVSA